MKNGQKPITEKYDDSDVYEGDANLLTVDSKIKKEIESKGLDGRFISYKEYIANGQHHVQKWKPYKIDYAKMGISTDFMQGQDVSGYIRRGDLIFATRSKQISAGHRAKLSHLRSSQRQKAARDGAVFDDLKKAAKAAGVRAVTGIEDNEE